MDADIDLRRYDNDGPDGRPDSGDDDGFVDYVFINMRSTPAGFLRGRATGIGALGQEYVSDDIGRDGNPIRISGSVGRGAIQQEGGFRETVGVMTHEFGHGLGLPDLYDLGYAEPIDDSAGIGRWGTMGWGALGWNGGDGPNPLSAWSLLELGWVSPDNGRLIDVGDDRTITLRPMRAGGAVVRVPLGAGLDEEYLLLEHRTRGGSHYDRNTPAEGVLVWRVRPGESGNFYEDRKLVDLVCADGLYRDAGYPLGARPDGRNGGDNLDYWAHDDTYRADHRGNQGDATDPFDGLRQTRLQVDGNPSTLPAGELSHAFTGLDISMRRRGDDMEVRVNVPFWSGAIHDVAVWAGNVFVRHDVDVAPRGKLIVAPSTQVRVASRDLLRQGRDPDRVEITVRGNLELKGKNGAEVVFESAVPGALWHGLLLEPAPDRQVEIDPRGVILRDATHGITFPRAPAGVDGVARARSRLIDGSTPHTAGNGDGQLTPGETFQLALDIDNWSVETYRTVRGQLRWLNPGVVGWEDSDIRGSVLDVGAIYPGAEETVSWPSLTLSPDAVRGDRVGFTVTVQGLDRVYNETLSYVVQGTYPVHSAQLSVLDRPAQDGLVVIPDNRASTFEAVIDGRVAAAELVATPGDGQGPGLELPMIQISESIFRADFHPPETGAWDVRLRVQGEDGSVVFSDAGLDMWALNGEELPPLVIIGSEYNTNRAERIGSVLKQQFDALGMNQHLIHLSPKTPFDFQRLMAYYGSHGGLVVWVSRIGSYSNAGLQALLSRGGRLLLASNVLYPTSRERDFLETHLYATFGGSNVSSNNVLGVFPMAGVSFKVQHAWFNLIAPAEPILLNHLNRPAGLRLDNGTYRAVFLPFELGYVADSILDGVLGPSLRFLQQEAVRSASLDVGSGALGNQSALWRPGARIPLHASVEGAVSRVEVLVNRGAPNYGERIGSLVLQPSDSDGDVRTFRGSYLPPADGRYRFVLRPYDEQGKVVVTSAYLNVLVHDTDPDLLVLRDTEQGDGLIEALDRQAGVLTIDAGDWQVMDQLLEPYQRPDAAVAVLTGGLNQRLLKSFRRFLANGGRMLLISTGVAESTDGEAFLREVAGIARPHRHRSGTVLTRDLLPSIDMAPRLHFLPFQQLVAPAVPLARTLNDRLVAVRRQDDAASIIYIAAAARHLETADGHRFAAAALDLLVQGPPADADMTINGERVTTQNVLLNSDVASHVQAQVRGDVARVELLAQDFNDLTSAFRIPMTSAGADMFQVDFRPPAVGHYLLSLQLHTRDGDSFPASSSVRADALTFQEVKPVLLLLNDNWPEAVRSAVAADVGRVLADHGLEANVVAAPEDEPVVEALLTNYLYQGKMVMWMGRMLMEGAQEAVRRYLDSGGRMLVASADVRYSPGGQSLLRDWFGVEAITMGFPKRGQAFFASADPTRQLAADVNFAPMAPTQLGNVALTEYEHGVAGIRVDHRYRSVIFSFDMNHINSEARRGLLTEQVAFLMSGDTTRTATEFTEAEHVPNNLFVHSGPSIAGPVAVGSVAPVITIRNNGRRQTRPFRAGYEILQGDSIIASIAGDELTLLPGEQRQITLPPWGEAVAGDFRVRVGASPHVDSALVFEPLQPLHLAQQPNPFERVNLPGAVSLGNGAAMFDADGDGDLEVHLVRRGAADQLWRREFEFSQETRSRVESFVEVAASSGLQIEGNGRGTALGDMDADGDLDLYLVTEADNYWLRSDGLGHFSDESDKLPTDNSEGRSAGFFDADGDGDLDLFVVNASGGNKLFIQSAGTFVEAAQRYGLIDDGSGRGLAVADIDEDGDADLFVANSSGGSRLWRNDLGHFTAVEQAAGLDLSAGAVGAAFGDINGDGWPDLFVAREGGANRLFENAGGGTFVDMARRDSLNPGSGAIGAAFLDADNDGDVDLVTTAAGPSMGGDELLMLRRPFLLPFGQWLGLAPSSNGRGLSVGDMDGDGRVDVLVADARSSRLYRNTLVAGSWLRVRLSGDGDNRWGLGARVQVWADGRSQTQQMYSSLGYGSQTHPVLHFGVGTASRIDSVVVTWPGGVRTVRQDVTPGQTLMVARSNRATAVAGSPVLPERVQLQPAYPNPFNASTTLRYALPVASQVELRLYAVNGQLVRRLVRGPQAAGSYQVVWDGLDDGGRHVASGVYFTVLQVGEQRRVGRLALIE